MIRIRLHLRVAMVRETIIWKMIFSRMGKSQGSSWFRRDKKSQGILKLMDMKVFRKNACSAQRKVIIYAQKYLFPFEMGLLLS